MSYPILGQSHLTHHWHVLLYAKTLLQFPLQASQGVQLVHVAQTTTDLHKVHDHSLHLLHLLNQNGCIQEFNPKFLIGYENCWVPNMKI